MTASRDLVEHATAFVAEAERMTNERDVEGIRTVFAPHDHWTATLDGLVIEANGVEEIRRSWATMCAFMEKRRMYVKKTLVLADSTIIVNEWVGDDQEAQVLKERADEKTLHQR